MALSIDKEPLLSIKGLCKSYDEQPVLRELALDLSAGEIIAITGPSGCGKTTLLNLIAGLDDPDQGQIILAGQAINQLSEHERTLLRRSSIGFIFQFFNLIPTLTVEENCCLPLELNQLDTQREKILIQLENVGLKHKHKQFPEQLSGGEQQRVAIIRALSHNPRLILADEPTGNLDQNTADKMADFLYQQVKNSHSALLMVTHSENLAKKADRILHLENQQLI